MNHFDRIKESLRPHINPMMFFFFFLVPVTITTPYSYQPLPVSNIVYVFINKMLLVAKWHMAHGLICPQHNPCPKRSLSWHIYAVSQKQMTFVMA